MRIVHKTWLPLITALALAACGGSGNSGGMGMSTTPAAPVEGSLLQTPPQLMSTLSASNLLAQLSGAATAPLQQLLSLVGSPVCDIAVYHIEYHTVGGANEATTASGALMVPTGTHANCTGARPIVLYAHGTSTERGFNIADLTNEENAEGLFLAAVFASQGYIVVAPNYVGYDTSTLPYDAFLVGAQQSADMIDALTAARSALPAADAPSTTDGGKLFITGYSQGGYVALATHRAMQAAGLHVTASAPMSGPYALAAFVDAVFEGQVDGGAPVVATMLFTGYQNSYGNIYADPSDVFEPQYASGIDSLLPTTSTRSELYAQGKLPQYALFSATPPDPMFADITPATAPSDLAPVFALGFGAGNLITNSYRLAYLLDAQANPDGGFPTMTTGVPAATPTLPMRAALKQNDLRNWTPNAPVLLCGGDQDPEVYWFNAQLQQAYWASQSPAPATSVLDLDSSAATGDPYAALKTQFTVAKDAIAANAVLQGATDNGYAAVETAYHSTLVPPFCLSAVKSLFDGL
ncbi:MAG TPA: lipase family protein [Steroidobacteraceae bacterium]|jgi:alpha/beta superfamily hydrolase